jgi:hypothetical protein
MESAGLSFSSYVQSTFLLITKLLFSQPHDSVLNCTGESHFQSNQFSEILAKMLVILLGVLGPELQVNNSLSMTAKQLMDHFHTNSEPYVIVESLKALQQFILLSPKVVEIAIVVPFLQSLLLNSHTAIRRASLTCLRQLTLRDAKLVAKVGQYLPEQLFSMLDLDKDHEEVRDVVIMLMKETSYEKCFTWINICRDCLAKNVVVEEAGEPGDEHSPKKNEKPKAGSDNPFLLLIMQQIQSIPTYWRTQVFATKVLRLLLGEIKEPDHVDMIIAKKKHKTDQGEYLVFRVPDLIRLAFNAATSSTDELRLEGLLFMKEILLKFCASQDPEFEGHSLLEQFQVIVFRFDN